MLTGITAWWRAGYTGDDHLIDSRAEEAIERAVKGKTFRRSADALRAAEKAWAENADYRVRIARIQVALRTARGERIEIG